MTRNGLVAIMLLAVVACGTKRTTLQTGPLEPPPPVVIDTTVWDQLADTQWYFNWSTLYQARGEYDYGVWQKAVLERPATFADEKYYPLLRYNNVRQMDALVEYNCASGASITRASTLRSFDGQILTTPEPADKVSYAIPGTIGAQLVDLVCAVGQKRLGPRR